jgi:excisionase family DNA binding protein
MAKQTKPKVRWLTPKEAQRYLHIGKHQLYDAYTRGGLRHSRLGYRTLRFLPEWLDEWALRHAETNG